MAILSDKDLRELIEDNNAVRVDRGPEINFDNQLGPSSFDLRLGYEFGVLETRKLKCIDTKKMGQYSDLKKKTSNYRGRYCGTSRRVCTWINA